jgi:hypothetical protein
MSDFFRGISIAEIAHADVPYLQSGYSTYSQGSYGNGYGQSSYGNGYSQSSYGYSQGSYGPSESSYDMVQTPDGDWVCANGADYTENEDGTLTEIVWIDDGDDGGSESSTK